MGGDVVVGLQACALAVSSAINDNDKFTYVAPMPVVTGISPTSGPAVGGTTVTITGTGFTGVTSVGFGSTGVNVQRSAERRVGKGGRSRWTPYHYKKKATH